MTISKMLVAALGLIACFACQAAGPTPAPQPTPDGKMCGGIAAIRCGAGEYCHYAEGACRTIADASGICRKLPQICPMIYAPVCGCDGTTYSNACVAASHGVSVGAKGACKTP
jgi:hypothetical protein